MSSRDKENPISKLKQFFRTTKNSGGELRERDLWPALEKELRPETPVAQRCKALKELGDLVLTQRFEDASLKKLWDLTKDLIVDNKSTEHRQTTLTFYRKLIQGQYENLSLMREHFFLVIQKHEVSEDLGHRLELLKTLTDNGKDITFFEEKIGKFMLEWMPAILQAGLTDVYLEMLNNIIKFNAAHLDNEIVVGIVQHSCDLSCQVSDVKIGLQCLEILDTVICYAIFPNETRAIFLATLCRTVNSVPYCEPSWKIMKKLLGTDLGHVSLLTMCDFLNDQGFYNDELLLRGAVFHINMGIWGSNCAVFPMLRTCPSSVLISFLRVLESKQLIVTYEVILSIQMFVPKCGKNMAEHTWDVICDILYSIADNISYYESNRTSNLSVLKRHFHEAIDTIEQMLQRDEISVNPDLIYNLIERIAEDRHETSVLKLIEYRTSKISATCLQWLQVLNAFIQRFYSISNTRIRIKTVESLMNIMDSNRAAYEEDILERVVIPHFANISGESDILVRSSVAKALIEFARHCDTRRCDELLEILEKMINRPFEIFTSDGIILRHEKDFQDVVIVVDGLVEVFLIKLYRLPSCHAIRIFDMLVRHLEQHYQRPSVFESFNVVRYKIFNWMLKARANGTYHIGFPNPINPGTIRFSHYLGIDASQPYQGASFQHQMSSSNVDTIPSINFTTISIRRGCKSIVMCIDKEKDIYVLKLVLSELPLVLQNKALIQGNDIESLATVLLKNFGDRKYVDTLTPFAVKPTSDDFHALVLPAIASLVIYHQFLPPHKQQVIIEALKMGIPSRTARICINTLTIMILEMSETLMRQLPDVLLEMSKMSDTVNVAIPVLEFLSILSRLPNHLFANFVPRQYMYVFAISLPYTKPHRYDHYTVSLAHHVIAGWFLKCKLPLRRNFVNYIITSIQSNANLPFKDEKINRTETNAMNEDSSNRKRSSSLTERGARGRDRTALNTQSPNSDLRPLMNESLKSFHMELAETCIDFIARHTFSPCSALPKRLPTAEYLLKDAPSQTWLVGHNLITITTSGCSTDPTRNGLCDSCALKCKLGLNSQKPESSSTSTVTLNSPEVISGLPLQKSDSSDTQHKRYTKASLQYSSGTESGSTDLTSSTSSSSHQQTQNAAEGRTLRQTSNEGRFSSSSSSLEALSRRGSNPDSAENREGSVNSLLGNSLQHQQPQIQQHHQISTSSMQQQICACSCTGWAEIYIRRPTGSISWIMRIQNPIANDVLGNDMPLHDLIGLFMPSQHGGVFGPEFLGESQLLSPLTVIQSNRVLEQRQCLHDDKEVKSTESEQDKNFGKMRSLKRQEEVTAASGSGPIDIPKQTIRYKEPAGSFSDVDPDEGDVSFEEGESRSRNPVRRVNSSPEMSSNWKNPFLGGKQPGAGSETKDEKIGDSGVSSERDEVVLVEADQQSKKKGFGKDMRVSCEAIPEEIAGSTPPSLTESLKDSDTAAVHVLGKKSDSAVVLPQKQKSADDVPQSLGENITSQAAASNLNIPLDLQKITSKPPQSPAPLSPRLLARNAANKIAQASFAPTVRDNSGSDSNGSDMPRGRSKTISVVGELNRNTRPATSFRPRGGNTSSTSRLGISPNFVFLQLFYTGQVQVTDQPIKVGKDHMNSVTLLDLLPPFETHNIGVLYVGSGQCNNEIEILKNRFGSVRYIEFLRNLGTLVSLKDAKENNIFVNMEASGRDGNFTYVWKDDIVQVTFHVATLMPNKDGDPNCTEKKKHIGNDFVSIIYNESGEEYNLNTIKGQLNSACVVVEPLELSSNRIFVRAKNEIAEFVCHPEPKIVSDSSAPLLARQLALHANLASQVFQSLKTKTPYASNWLERLRRIKRLKSKLIKDSQSLGSSGDQPIDSTGSPAAGDVANRPQRPNIYDFTKYT